MFNSTNGYSLADVAAATGGNRNDDFMGNGAWWIIILFLFAFTGYGNGGVFGGSTGSGITDGYILTSDFAAIERKLDGVDNGLCDGFYAMNTGMLNGFAGVNNTIMQGTNTINAGITGLSSQMAQCCCDQRYENATNFANLNYRLAEQSCQTRQAVADSTTAIIANQDANTRSVLDFLTQDKIASLQAENQSLKFAASQEAQNNYLISALSPVPVPAYVVPNPRAGCNSTGCLCNTNIG